LESIFSFCHVPSTPLSFEDSGATEKDSTTKEV